MATKKPSKSKAKPKSSGKAGQLQSQSAPPTAGVVGGYSYPNFFPYDSVKEVVRIITANSVATEKAAFGKHIWVLQGYAQSMLLGDPDQLNFNVGEKDTQSEAIVDILNSLTQVHEQSGDMSPQALDDTMVKMSASGGLSLVLRWAVTKLLELIEQELGSMIL